jgi:hypothetical protein
MDVDMDGVVRRRPPPPPPPSTRPLANLSRIEAQFTRLGTGAVYTPWPAGQPAGVPGQPADGRAAHGRERDRPRAGPAHPGLGLVLSPILIRLHRLIGVCASLSQAAPGGHRSRTARATGSPPQRSHAICRCLCAGILLTDDLCLQALLGHRYRRPQLPEAVLCPWRAPGWKESLRAEAKDRKQRAGQYR